MASNKRKIFNDPVHGFITIPHELIFDIVEHPYFQRLRRIQQLGLSSYVYPGANHTRFHHALGAFHLMRKAISVLKIKGHEITEKEELGALAAILLHDIGHGPFSHTLEGVIVNVHHESLSRIYLHYFNDLFKGKLDIAFEIFEGSYDKGFLCQLVSSQLDVDRLDYLTRDSFFTGVTEGVIAYDRLIEMMNVKNGMLVIEQKGIYSVENFIIARRLMYWQVYLHKTVVCVEKMLIHALQRAKELTLQGVILDGSPALLFFFRYEGFFDDFLFSPNIMEKYSQLDDMDIISALKSWRYSDDLILSFLSSAILDRRLFKIQMRNDPYLPEELDEKISDVARQYKMSRVDASLLVWTGSASNHAYNPAEDKINILGSDGTVTDIADCADQFNISGLSKPVVKYYLCYPKGTDKV